ncbi:hybrid sensor histidine kinase/response regulator [Gymnodinialimonas ceratoperidinii]|uniref:hybrid sensor histidine kinase/response regulator n=1 Tax=Gymnodinialimonas ceratoperidinii TaxID=2856823 RepID=UPI001FFCD703|nr:ATP-binding protein [Gymnodinialimonas ceratoperidinii]
MTDETADRVVTDARGIKPFVQPAVLLVLGLVAGAATLLAPGAELRFGLMAATGGFLAAASLVALRDIWRIWRVQNTFQAAFSLIQHDPAPCFCTDDDGAIVLQNAAADRRFGERLGLPMARAIASVLPNAAAVVFRQETALGRRPSAHEVIVTPRGTVRLAAHRLNGGVIWRLDDLADANSRQGEWIGLPMMVVSHNDTVLSMNSAMRDVLGRRATTLEDVFPEQPLVAGRRSSLSGADGKIEVIPIVVPSKDGRREVYAVPGLSEPPAASVAARAFESLPVALLHISADGEVQASNYHAQKLLGVEPGTTGPMSQFVENLGRPVSDWVADTLAERVPNRSEVARAKQRRDETFLQISLSRIVDGTGPSLLAVLHDATELKTLEQQFVQSQKMQAIGELAGGVAHDFNNLLTAITGHCDLLLLRHDQGDQDYADLMQINQNANRAASLVGQLLAFSRKQTLEPEVLDLADSIGELTHLLNRLVGEKIKLTLSNDPELLPIRADRRQLDQVIMNLVVNARDAMPDGGEVRVETRMVHLTAPMSRDQAIVPKGSYVTIRVRDHGHGVSPDKLNRIFEPFFTTKRTGEGTGLGLSMAYGIVKQTGGYIFVDSVLGSGTTFTIYIPAHLKSGEGPTVELIESNTSELIETANEGRPGVVLLVEDEAPVRAFASRALRLRGYTVMEAGSAEEALETLSDTGLEVDLFVTDVIMPGMDGPSWVRKALKDRPGTKVVFVSGYADDAMAEGSMSVPGSVFLPKPFSLVDLTETVRQQLH